MLNPFQRNAETGGIVLIGPGQHFGVELVRRFAAERRRVAVLSFRRSSIDSLRRDLGADAASVLFVQADVADTPAFARALREAAEDLGRVDGLIYNPKVSVKASGLATEPQDLDHSMAVNVTGAMIAIQTLLPHLQESRGRVILTGGGYKDTPDPEKFALAVGKAGMHGLFKALREPLQRRGISVKTVIIDGAVRRTSGGETSADRLADFYWSVFNGAESGVRIHRFPREQIDEQQFKLFA